MQKKARHLVAVVAECNEGLASRSDVPQLYAQYFELSTIVTKRLVAKCGARCRHAMLEVIIKPQAVMAIAIATLA